MFSIRFCRANEEWLASILTIGIKNLDKIEVGSIIKLINRLELSRGGEIFLPDEIEF